VLACAGACIVCLIGRQLALALIYLAAAIAAFGAYYNHWYRDFYAADDIGEFAAADPRPVKVRGCISEEPSIKLRPKQGALQSFAGPDPTVTVLKVSQIHNSRDWLPISGNARLVINAGNAESQGGKGQANPNTGEVTLHVGDEVEVVGRLVA